MPFDLGNLAKMASDRAYVWCKEVPAPGLREPQVKYVEGARLTDPRDIFGGSWSCSFPLELMRPGHQY